MQVKTRKLISVRKLTIPRSSGTLSTSLLRTIQLLKTEIEHGEDAMRVMNKFFIIP